MDQDVAHLWQLVNELSGMLAVNLCLKLAC